MVIASEVCKGRLKDPNKINSNDFKLKFTFTREDTSNGSGKKVTKEQADMWAKARWASLISKAKIVNKEDNQEQNDT